MADPQALDGLSWDQRQELKEAVCDAVLERARQVVTGDGAYGSIILNERPSRKLSSGFVLPRLNPDSDDESSDIRIATHGLDFRIRAGGDGVVTVSPTLNAYVRALPTSDEMFARNGWLIPSADFNDGAKTRIKDAINLRSHTEIPQGTPSRERAVLRAAISREVHVAMGVGVPENSAPPVGNDREIDDAGGDPRPPPTLGDRLRIPNAMSRRYEVPMKWVRLPVEAKALVLPLPCDPAAWERAAIAYKTVLKSAITAAYHGWLATPDGQANAWRKVRPPSEALWSREAWERFLLTARAAVSRPEDLVPNFDVQLLVQALPDPLEPSEHSVRIAIENLQEDDETLEFGLYGVSLTVDIPTQMLGPMRLERVRRSYHLAGFMTMPAIGVNGGVVDLGVVEGARRLQTTWMPRYVLPRTKATEIASVPTAYQTLASEGNDIGQLSALADAMDEWITFVAGNTSLSRPGEEGDEADEAAQRTRFEDDLQAWRRERERIRKGIRLLADSQRSWLTSPGSTAAIPYRAWLFLNRSFAHANPSTGGQRPGWRLFQLAFVLAHVPTFASRIPECESEFDATFDEDSASLLYMATGGGKTEAFFGILVFALFLDRLRGKHRGVTAMMHYPLRLLTVQQSQRLARLLASAEMVRRRGGVPGSPFEIGFWVGGSNTPNSTEKTPGTISDAMKCIPLSGGARARDEVALYSSQQKIDREYVIANESWNKLPKCPFCNSDRGTGLRLFPTRHHRLGIVCLDGACDWNEATRAGDGEREPLPFLLVDTDIYRAAPSVLLGTIDKLALLGQNTHTVDRVAGMFGMARHVQGGLDGLLHMVNGAPAAAPPPDGYERVAPSYQDGCEVFFDPFPSLIVQDEMHLLEESLGTFGGIFETALFEWLTRLAPLLGNRVSQVPGIPGRSRLPHVVGATATAADIAKHTRALYQRQVVQFPHPGPALHEGFYTRIALFERGGEAERARAASGDSPAGRERAAPWGRVYASLMTNGRLHTVTTLSVLAAHAATITRWQRNLSSPDAAKRQRAAEEMQFCVSAAPWSDRRRAAIRAAAAEKRFDRLANLVDLHRIQLTYVTNKKGGDQILSALESEVREIHAVMGEDYGLGGFAMELISGGVDIGGIQSVIRRAEEPFDPMTSDISETLRGIVATSAISHGVDVESFNAMAFAGMPSDIAEYIQASSRVGRMHVGFSLLVPTPQTRRDRFVVEVHESFHRLLERMISPPAVERWADRAIERTIPSLVQTWLAGVRHNERFVAAATGDKGNISLPSTVEGTARLLRERNGLDDCVAFVMAAVGVGAVTGAPSNPEYYGDLVRAAVQLIQATVNGGDFTGRLQDFWSNRNTGLARPMTSLRDVDAQGMIEASNRSQRNQRLTWEDIGDAMAMIRNRGITHGRHTANSELDLGIEP
jgi:hypothetical protein